MTHLTGKNTFDMQNCVWKCKNEVGNVTKSNINTCTDRFRCNNQHIWMSSLACSSFQSSSQKESFSHFQVVLKTAVKSAEVFPENLTDVAETSTLQRS